MSTKPTTIAFYLPQFHPIPENDGWYGTGFTEWRNVATASPLFKGHYQPHIPKDLGFYDLRVPETREQQARLAREHGIDAFCYYHYWFAGQRPLRRVVDEVLEHGTPNMPFCLAWANENWSRHWDASTHEVLLRQTYSDEDDDAHAVFLLRAMLHPLYLRLNGRPVLFIYRISGMPDPKRTLDRWREIWRANGIEDVHIVKFDTHHDFSDPSETGADAAAQFLPHGTADVLPRLDIADAHPGNTIMSYEDMVEHYIRARPPAWRRYENVVPGWDNTPRRGDGRSLIVDGQTPELYERWLSAIYERAGADGLVLINAWNEWAEGAHLEPDLKFGDAFLKATARAIGVPEENELRDPVLPLAAVPFKIRDRFADLYLDTLEAQTLLQRRLSRLEATLERQIAAAQAATQSEVDALRAAALTLTREVTRLREQLAQTARDAGGTAALSRN